MRGQYVIVNDKEIDRLRTESERAINLEAVIEPGSIDPIYFDGRTYYLVPDGQAGKKPYAVLWRGAGKTEPMGGGAGRAVWARARGARAAG